VNQFKSEFGSCQPGACCKGEPHSPNSQEESGLRCGRTMTHNLGRVKRRASHLTSHLVTAQASAHLKSPAIENWSMVIEQCCPKKLSDRLLAFAHEPESSSMPLPSPKANGQRLRPAHLPINKSSIINFQLGPFAKNPRCAPQATSHVITRRQRVRSCQSVRQGEPGG
jgi:hypothetical protein